MAQGNLKTKVKLPNGAKKKGSHPKKQLGPKKGGRTIAPRKAKSTEAVKLKQAITKTLNAQIERQITTQAAKTEHTNLRLLQVKSDTSS